MQNPQEAERPSHLRSFPFSSTLWYHNVSMRPLDCISCSIALSTSKIPALKGKAVIHFNNRSNAVGYRGAQTYCEAKATRNIKTAEFEKNKWSWVQNPPEAERQPHLRSFLFSLLPYGVTMSQMTPLDWIYCSITRSPNMTQTLQHF